MRRLQGAQDILPRTDARIDKAARLQFLERSKVEWEPLALRVRAAGSAAIRPLLPLKAKPAKIFQHCRDEFWPGAGSVQIFVAQNESPAAISCSLLRSPKCPGMSQMQETCWRWREASPVWVVYCRRQCYWVNTAR